MVDQPLFIDGRDEGSATHIPEHGAGETLGLDILRLEGSDVRRVVRDELALRGVVRIAGDIGRVLEDTCTCQGENVVRVDASLDRARTDLMDNRLVQSPYSACS